MHTQARRMAEYPADRWRRWGCGVVWCGVACSGLACGESHVPCGVVAVCGVWSVGCGGCGVWGVGYGVVPWEARWGG